MTPKKRVRLALVDDHTLFRKGLISLIEMVNPNSEILFEADNGIDLQHRLNPRVLPEIILMDINMPGMDGFDAVKWLAQNYPSVHVLVVSMVQKEDSIMRMLKMGVKGYVCKDVEPQVLGEAIDSILNSGFYYTDFITGKLVHSLKMDDHLMEPQGNMAIELSEKEKHFLRLICSDYTYVEIAKQMFLSPRTIDGYRDALFEKLNIRSRVGLAIFAIKSGVAVI